MAAWALHPDAPIAEAAAPEGDSAADLVRRLYEDGSWTARLSSFYVRSETIRTETPEGRPAGTPSEAEALKGSRHLTEFGFDRKRLKDAWRSEEGSS